MQDESQPSGPRVAKSKPLPTVRRRKKRYMRMAKLPVGNVLSRCFGMYFKNFLPFTLITLIVFSPVIVLRLLFPGDELPDIAWTLFYIMVQPMATGAIIYGVFRRLKGNPVNLGGCLGTGFGSLLPLLGVAIMTGLIVVLISLIPAFLVGFIGMAIASATGSNLLTYPIMLLAWVPGLLAYSAFYSASPILVVEEEGMGKSLRRSIDLTRGNLWRILVTILVIWIFQLLVGLILGFIAGAMVDELSAFSMILLELGISLIYIALNATLSVLVFFELKVQVEGVDEQELASVFD